MAFRTENGGNDNSNHAYSNWHWDYKCVLDGIPHSVLKDWRKVRKLKQTGEAFLQDDSCAEIGPNVQKCRECRLDRSRKSQEPAISPVFCRFYYFRRSVFNTFGTVLGHMWTPCDALHLRFIWFIIGAIFTQVSCTSTVESNFNDMHSSLFKTWQSSMICKCLMEVRTSELLSF